MADYFELRSSGTIRLVKLTLTADPGYLVGTASAVKVKISGGN